MVPLLQDEGIAVIEDVQDFSWFDALKMCVPKNCSYEIVDRRAIKGRYDDLMLIIKRASKWLKQGSKKKLLASCGNSKAAP
jgi:hypothetical protein